jgi:hypothetical protein
MSNRNDKQQPFWAKALFFRTFNKPGLKSGVIDNEPFADFSPKIIEKYSFNYLVYIINYFIFAIYLHSLLI